MKSSWRTAWQRQDIVVYRNETEVDRLHAPAIERVVLVHRSSGNSPGDLVQAVVELGDACLIFPADTGFGGPSNVAQTVKKLERVGLAGLHIEDQVFPKRCGHLTGHSLIPTREMAEKIKAAVRARRDPNFLIIARTDSNAVEGMDSAIESAPSRLIRSVSVPPSMHGMPI